MQLQAFRIWGRAAPGCYGYATVCIKLYSYKCDMYAIRLPTATACPWPGPGARQPAVHLHAGCRRSRGARLDAVVASCVDGSTRPRAPGPAGPRPGEVAARASAARGLRRPRSSRPLPEEAGRRTVDLYHSFHRLDSCHGMSRLRGRTQHTAVGARVR